MRKVALASLLFSLSVQSQQKATIAGPPPLVEKIDVSVVNVDVTVTDRHGQPVAGLTQNDFVVFEDGKPQTITNFYLVENAGVHETTNAAAEAKRPEQRFRRKVLVLIDNRNTTKHARNEALVKLEQFIDAHFDDGRYDWSIATLDSRVHLVLPMTSDKRVLHSVVQEIQRHGTTHELRALIGHGDSAAAPMGTDDASGDRVHQQIASFGTENKNFDQEMNLAEQTMFAASSTAAIVEAARAFGSGEGRKMILLVTGHMPFGNVSPLSRVGEGPMLANHIENITRNDRQLTTLRDHLIHEANASNTSFYIIDAEGLEPPALDGVSAFSTAFTPGSAAQDHSAEYWLASETGGAYFPGNRMEQSFEEFDRRAANFYSLGFVSKHPADMRYHRLVVRLKGHSGLKLQYRDGYSSGETDVQLVRALRSPLGAAMQLKTMPLSLIVGDPQYRGVTALVSLQAAMAMESLQYITDGTGSRTRLHVYVSIFDSDGRNITLAKSFADITVLPNETATGPMTITLPPLSLGKGTYNVVVAVRDELTDHVGVTTKRLEL